MFELFRGVVWREDIDDTQIVNDVHGVIRLVGGAEATLVLVEQEMSSIGGIGSRQLRHGRC